MFLVPNVPSDEGESTGWRDRRDRCVHVRYRVGSTYPGCREHDVSVHRQEPFVARYFDMMLPVWESRTYQIASYLIVGLYPAPLANVALRDATRGWVAENLAGVERALDVQEFDTHDA